MNEIISPKLKRSCCFIFDMFLFMVYKDENPKFLEVVAKRKEDLLFFNRFISFWGTKMAKIFGIHEMLMEKLIILVFCS